MANCIFCDKPAGSKEHVWPHWILARKDLGAFRMQRGDGPEIVLNKTPLITKAVCGKCNNGWMSDLEGEVQPILIPLFEDKPVSLDQSQQHILATWVTKMAFLLESTKGRNAKNAFYTKAEGLALKESRQIPQISSIWIGRLDGVHRALTGTDFTRKSDLSAIRGIVTTLTNEHFVAQIVSLHLENPPTVPTQIPLQENPGEWDNTLTIIWPSKHAIVNWPPGASFTNGGPRGYAYLLERWRVGNKVSEIT
jgi:hypothetical protein